MTDVATLRAQLESLQAARRSGVTSSQFGDRRVQYRSDAEMVNAIASLQNEIAALDGSAVVRSINVRSKGWS
jgi:hypothetical protein